MRLTIWNFPLLALIVISLCSGCGGPQPGPSATVPAVTVTTETKQEAATVAAATPEVKPAVARKVETPVEIKRVEVFRVSPREIGRASGKTDVQTINGYPILATGTEQGPEFADRLIKILRGRGVTKNKKKCGLEPGVAYRIWTGKKAEEVLVCFNCDVLWPHVVGVPMGDNPHYEWKDFDPVRGQILALTKEAFPDDAEIQALPAIRMH
jgi:hypothetical protein